MIRSAVALAAVGLLAASLLWVAGTMPVEVAPASARIAEKLAGTGASHPVTGVLLGFRAYDTLLEVAVLLLAVAGTAAARAAPAHAPVPVRAHPVTDPALRGLVPVLGPTMVLVAGYLLWAGTHAPGGAFQAAAVLAAASILLALSDVLPAPDADSRAVRVALAFGLAAFLLVFHLGALPRALLAVESALTLSIALALACLFGARRP